MANKKNNTCTFTHIFVLLLVFKLTVYFISIKKKKRQLASLKIHVGMVDSWVAIIFEYNSSISDRGSIFPENNCLLF